MLLLIVFNLVSLTVNVLRYLGRYSPGGLPALDRALEHEGRERGRGGRGHEQQEEEGGGGDHGDHAGPGARAD